LFFLAIWRHNEYFYSRHTIPMFNLSSLWVGAFTVGYDNKNHDTLFCFVLSLEIRIQQNECSKMLSNERGICMFKLSLTNKCYNEWFKLIEQILNVLFKYKPQNKWTITRHDFQKWDTFIWSAKTLLKHHSVLFLHPRFLYFFPNFWNVIS
jgi:hypothetical protein